MRAAAVLALVTLCYLGSGCGGGEAPAQAARAGHVSLGRCSAVGSHAGVGYRLCNRFSQITSPGTFYAGSRRLRVALPVRRRPGQPVVGHWEWAAVSPDGKTLLAQWSAECETPIAYFVDAGGGEPRPVVSSRVESVALGWTTDGRAIVDFPRGACASGLRKPGVYLVSTAGDRTYRKRTENFSRRLRSLRPRDVG